MDIGVDIGVRVGVLWTNRFGMCGHCCRFLFFLQTLVWTLVWPCGEIDRF